MTCPHPPSCECADCTLDRPNAVHVGEVFGNTKIDRLTDNEALCLRWWIAVNSEPIEA